MLMFGGPGVYFVNLTKKNTRFYNVFLWLMLSVGNALLMVLYSREWYARYGEHPVQYPVSPRCWRPPPPSSSLTTAAAVPFISPSPGHGQRLDAARSSVIPCVLPGLPAAHRGRGRPCVNAFVSASSRARASCGGRMLHSPCVFAPLDKEKKRKWAGVAAWQVEVHQGKAKTT